MASCRVALAALIHDVGKFSERARISLDKDTIERHKHQYCPFNEKGGWHSHVHAAYTAMSIDILEQNFPEIIGEDVYPFVKWGDPNVDDSLINAAARHHRPETALQWIIATADRVASGFEREEFERYNQAGEEESGKNHYQSRLLTLFEQVSVNGTQDSLKRSQLKYRYPLKPLSADSIFPQLLETCEPTDNKTAQKEYKTLWDKFILAIADIPRSHQRMDLWLDHFDSLWQTFTHAIPSATAGRVRPEVSLYDHSHTTAALAVALWRYHSDQKHDDTQIITGLKDRSDWQEDKLLLIQGDLFGIQNFIFSDGAQTSKKAAKLLRGRSFYVSLLSELAALKILETLHLPATSQIINAAGKFLIVAANTPETREQLKTIRDELNEWFLTASFGQTGIGIAWQSACCQQFVQSHDNSSARNGFSELIKKLFEQLESAKLQRFNLCSASGQMADPVFNSYLDSFDNELGSCPYNHYLPAQNIGNESLHPLSFDQIKVGEYLSKYERIIISREDLQHHTLSLPLFGYYISFSPAEEQSGRFGQAVAADNIRRVWDISLPQGSETLFKGYARRNINSFVPLFSIDDVQHQEKYDDLDPQEQGGIRSNAIKSFNHLACEDRQPSETDALKWQGQKALMTLKGDVDNLGSIFEAGLVQPTFAKMAAFSRQMNNFFAVALPQLCAQKYPNTYTVFAGGDDFFLIGPWYSQQKLVQEMAKTFAHYVAQNPQIHFSAGLYQAKTGLPVPALAEHAEQALEQAKSYCRSGSDKTQADKNAVTVYGRTMNWQDYKQLVDCEQRLEELKQQYGLSGSYIYSLLQLAQMAEQAHKQPQKAIWYSWFRYRTTRYCQDTLKLKNKEAALTNALNALGEGIALNGIKKFGGNYIVALYNHLYQLRT